jgi:hypothetical protein
MYVVLDVTDYGQQSELWIDPATDDVRRFVLLRDRSTTTVDFETIEFGRDVSSDVRFAVPFSAQRLSREHRTITLALVWLLVFAGATVLWTIAYRVLDDDPAARRERRLKRWRMWPWVFGIGYGCVGLLAALLWRGGGHPPAIILAYLAAYLWSLVLALSIAVLAAAHAAEALLTVLANARRTPR